MSQERSTIRDLLELLTWMEKHPEFFDKLRAAMGTPPTPALARPGEELVPTHMSQPGYFKYHRILTTKEAAALLKVTEKELQSWRYNKKVKVPYVKYDTGHVRYRLADVMQFIEENTFSDEASEIASDQIP